MGFLRTVLWILLGYYLLKLVGKLLRPWLQKFVNRKAAEFYQQASAFSQEKAEQPGRVGEVTIDRRPPTRKRTTAEVGEYIEYEEVD